jgi:HEAT repeat protein
MAAVVSALLAAWAATVLELAAVAVLHHGELTSFWELRTGTLWLLPTVLAGAAAPGLLGAALFGALRARPAAAKALTALFAGSAAGAMAALVTTGRHFAALPLRGGTIGLAVVASAGAAWALAPRLGRALRGSPGPFAAGAVLLAIGLEIGNHLVLVRLYPPFHAGLTAATVLAAAVAGAASSGRGPARSRARDAAALAVVLAVTLGTALLAAPAASRLSRFDNYRLVLVDHAPILGHAVQLAAVLAPPPPLDAVDPCLVDPERCAAAPTATEGPSFAGRDVVLVTVDALRADHVGAYGYGRATTPGIDALARESVVFERAYCPTPHTSYSVTSLMTGKYMRPLLLQGAGKDSETLATFLRTYGYKTAAFYPPAVFFIDQSRFDAFEQSHFGFEYRKVEFLEGEGRVRQVEGYVDRLQSEQRLFLWVHLFGPHEPYEAHPEHPFGDRDLDRYDSEIAAADDTVSAIVAGVRKRRPGAVVIVTADHGEEFGEHGGRYHGTTVYEEQVRVPLLIDAPGLLGPRRVHEVVQTIDLLPTLLASLAIPKSPRVRGRNLGPLLSGARPEEPGLAFAETEESSLLAEGPSRLVCARKLGACRLFDVERDPAEHDDLSGTERERFEKLRGELQALGASHGRFELQGLRSETGRGWPAPILRGIAGDADVAPDLGALLDDSDREIRRKAAELLFKLRRPDTVASLRLALGRDEDDLVRRWCALALTRMGQTVPLATDLFAGTDVTWRRLSALVLAEAGDDRGEAVLIEWWQHGARDDFERALDLLGAFAKIRSKDAVWPLVQSLGNVRLRPRIAQTLASIGDTTARGPLVAALADERYQTARIAIAEALVALGAKEELARPLIRFLGVPDPLPGGVGYAQRAGVLSYVGGPEPKNLAKLVAESNVGVRVQLVVPKGGSGGGVRVVVRATAAGRGGEVRVGKAQEPLQYDRRGAPINTREAPRIHDRDYVALSVPESASAAEVSATLPPALGAAPGRSVELVVFAERHVHIEGLVVVPLADELPPPPPEPWTPRAGDESQ